MPIRLNEKEKTLLRVVSIEHHINSTIKLLARLRTYSDKAVADNATEVWEGWKDCRGLIVKLWNQERTRIG